MREDKLFWKGLGSGALSVKSIRQLCFPLVDSNFDWKKLVWTGVAFLKVEMFIWLVIQKRVPVEKELLKRGISDDTFVVTLAATFV
ncbi:hypothetical protein V6N13_048955 [Hibiscus sabdariffa]|uniref:Reverse transcriptase zinc-binding domain-containing protein n=1 Tax=Hibiscus sabdariffa TaxID=183260 RepID=A0ABR2QYM3_9ROSI